MHDAHNPYFFQSISFILCSVSSGLYTPSSSIAGWITSDIHVSANTSVHSMCGVAPGVNRIGVKWEMMRIMRAMQVSASALESIGFRVCVNFDVSESSREATVGSVVGKGDGAPVPERVIALVSAGVGRAPVTDCGILVSGIDPEVSNTDFTTFCGSTVGAGRAVSDTSKSVVVTK
jgi:hypothetical protein